MKVLSIVGARPQFIKSALVSKLIRETGYKEILLHTGQHYDYSMSQVFFDELGIHKPDINLGVGSGSHGWQTGQMLIGIERIIQEQGPDWILVYGDTNSTLAGSLAAVKLRVPVAHVEAGLRSFNRQMPEEHNRILTDHCSDLLLCPTQIAVENLRNEGLTNGVYWVGDTMYDAVLYYTEVASQLSSILDNLDLEPQGYILATVHRPYNTDVAHNLRSIVEAFLALEQPVVFPVHPRTRERLKHLDFLLPPDNSNLKLIAPVGYLDMLTLEKHARLLLTDSGGMQKEAFFLGVPCVTLRPETEWMETVEAGWNVLVGADKDSIIQAATRSFPQTTSSRAAFGNGQAANKIISLLEEGLGEV